MASLKCNHCGFGIRYHDIPNGTQHYFYTKDAWEQIKASHMPIVCYDSDELGSVGHMHYVWKCERCGALAFFGENDVAVERVFVPISDPSLSQDFTGLKFVVFDDYTMEAVFEAEITSEQLFETLGENCCRYALMSEKYLAIYGGEDDRHAIALYEREELHNNLDEISQNF